MIDQINICDTLLKRNEIEPFLKLVITGDEKWIPYDNRSKIVNKEWIDAWKTRRESSTMSYFQLRQAIERKRPELNNRKGLSHPQYSPDIASSNYRINLLSKEACENHLIQFFQNCQKPQKFFTDGIIALLEKWRKVVDNTGCTKKK
ncbi:histone-lysine N-methyltransferase SETMAR-like [Xylocopa sonorina]|uniref:histone-lysine N-methyltransferase SETMAR-like n=1 Tax=Xylocopa sonorina TaxID=1818115 RepID=UPI00403A9031